MGRESEQNTWAHNAKTWDHFAIFGGITKGLQGSQGLTWDHKVIPGGSDPPPYSLTLIGSEPARFTL